MKDLSCGKANESNSFQDKPTLSDIFLVVVVILVIALSYLLFYLQLDLQEI